jgi:hypothetical protein
MQDMDIVIAWVDGNDAELQRKRHRYLTGRDAPDATKATRFASNNEIYYGIASILKHVAFCRRIFIVTDGQRPEFLPEFVQQGLCPEGKIRVVDHREIFRGYERHLPTFNTRSIETMLWNIEGLSDYFIYLNDDFFFNSEARIEDFLESGKIVIYGRWQGSFFLKAKLGWRKAWGRLCSRPVEPGHMIAQMRGADVLGFTRFFEVDHYPRIVDRNILRAYLLAHPDALQRQIQYKFRSVEQFNPISLMIHLKIQRGEAVLKPDIPLAYLKTADGIEAFTDALGRQDIRYGCVQSLDQIEPGAAGQIQKAMQEKFQGYLPASVTGALP